MNGPKLRRGEKQGDLLCNQSEPFRLVQESATDHKAIAKRAEEIAKQREEYDRKNQAALL